MSGNGYGSWGQKEVAAVAVGGLMVAAGLRRGSTSGLLVAAAGGALAYYGAKSATACVGGVTEVCERLSGRAKELYEAVGAGVNAGTFDHVTQAAKAERDAGFAGDSDRVDDALEDSFPASDPPAY